MDLTQAVTVVVATYGSDQWVDLARARAIPSATALGVKVIHRHGVALHQARNGGLAAVTTPWVVHLDADDELEDGYLDAMMEGTADVRAPAVRYIWPGHADAPRVPNVWGHTHQCQATCLRSGNWLVVGAMARTQLLRDVGGWRDFHWSEDWDLWLRCHLYGASFEALPRAIYRAYVRRDSRNRGQTQAARLAAHRAIATANGVESP